MLAIVGESGAGKSTLLHILGVLDRASVGDVYFAKLIWGSCPKRLPLSFEHGTWVCLAVSLSAAGVHRDGERRHAAADARQGASGRRRQQALHWLQEVGLADRASHRSGELSGGEQQRVALARALVTRPKLLMADEPTGDLDNRTAEAVFELIARLHRDYSLTSIIVTHNLAFARRCHRVLQLERGRMVEVSPESLVA